MFADRYCTTTSSQTHSADLNIYYINDDKSVLYIGSVAEAVAGSELGGELRRRIFNSFSGERKNQCFECVYNGVFPPPGADGAIAGARPTTTTTTTTMTTTTRPRRATCRIRVHTYAPPPTIPTPCAEYSARSQHTHTHAGYRTDVWAAPVLSSFPRRSLHSRLDRINKLCAAPRHVFPIYICILVYSTTSGVHQERWRTDAHGRDEDKKQYIYIQYTTEITQTGSRPDGNTIHERKNKIVRLYNITAVII